MTLTAREIASQPAIWREALAGHAEPRDRAAHACRASACSCSAAAPRAFVAESFAALREQAGFGVTDAAYASEPWPWRDYDRVIVLSRSGTTTEVLEALDRVPAGVRTDRRHRRRRLARSPTAPTTCCCSTSPTRSRSCRPASRRRSSLLARAAFGEDVSALPGRGGGGPRPPARHRRRRPLDHFVYLGSGWTYGLAQEAALKIREAAQAWSESYPLLDYRHGPLAVADAGSLVWIFGAADADSRRRHRAHRRHRARRHRATRWSSSCRRSASPSRSPSAAASTRTPRATSPARSSSADPRSVTAPETRTNDVTPALEQRTEVSTPPHRRSARRRRRSRSSRSPAAAASQGADDASTPRPR